MLFREQKVTVPRVSRRERASTRVLVAREFAGTRAPNTRERESTTRTCDEYYQREVCTHDEPFFFF